MEGDSPTLKTACTRLLSLAVAVIALGCQPVSAPEQARTDPHPLPRQPLQVETTGRLGGTLRVGTLGSPATFNLALALDLRSVTLSSLVTAPLLEFHRMEQRVVPGLAVDWKVSEDARSIVLTLREGVCFSDGAPFTADDVLFTFQKIYEEDSANRLKSSLLVGGQPLQVTRLGDLSVEVRSAQPYASLAYILTTVPMFPRHLLDQPGMKLEDYGGLDSRPEEMASLGPLVLEQHLPGRKSVFRYNPHYWKVDSNGTRLPYINRLEVQFIEDRNAEILRLEAGELDLLLDSLRPDEFLELKDSTHVRAINAGPASRLTFCWFNLSTGVNPDTGKPYLSPDKESWFTNLNFRQAVNLAISRDAIVQNAFLGQAQPAYSLIPVSIPTWHNPEIKIEHDPERARSLLRDAGFSWKTSDSGEVLLDPQGREVKFSLLTISESLWGRIAAIIQQDLEQIGMQAQVRQEEVRAAISRISNTRDYDMALLALDIPTDPVDHVGMLLSESPMHFWNPRQSSPATEWEAEIDRLMQLQTTTLDLEERRRLYQQVQEILAQHVPFIPLINRDILVAAGNKVKNFKPSPLSPHAVWNLWELWLE